MLKSILKTFAYLACLAWSGIVCATGLGEINVSSYLGQPLKAEIELVAVDKVDKTGISVRLASAEAFKSVGIDYPYSLPKLKFEVIQREKGDPYIKLTTLQAVNEPFVTLLVEATWSSGKLLREYTFLLDPVDYRVATRDEVAKPIQPVIITTKPLAPVVVEPPVSEVGQQAQIVSPQTPLVATPVQVTPQEAPHAEPAEIEQKPVAAAEPVSQQIPPPPEMVVTDNNAGADIPVFEVPDEIEIVRGDTLSKIALRVKPDGVSLDRMLVALYRANTDAFVGNNMNRLITGKIIRLPDETELENVLQGEAESEVKVHVDDWNAYRQQLASTRTAAREEQSRQESTGKITTAVTEQAAAKEPAKGVLKLSKGEAPGDTASVKKKASSKDEANARAEEAIAKKKSLKEAEERAALLEKNLKDIQRLAELKKQAAGGQATSAAASAVVVSEKPKVKTPKAVTPPEVAIETSLVDEVLQDPMLLAGVVVLLLALGGGAYWLVRSGKLSFSMPKMPSFKMPNLKREKVKTAVDTAVESEDENLAAVKIAAPVAPSPETGDYTHAAKADTTVITSADEVDPIGEADLFLTFGRDTQAEAVLKEALTINPNNIPVKLKLLSIYSNRKDTTTFYTVAREIKESGNEVAWNEAAALGRALEPSNPFYGGDGSAPTPDVVSPFKTDDHSVDFDLGFGTTTVMSPSEQNFLKTNVMGSSPLEGTTVLSADEMRVSHETPMDFDVTGSQLDHKSETELEVNPIFNMDEMMFDITSSKQSMSASGVAASSPVTNQVETSIEDLIFDVTTTNQGQAATAPGAPSAAEEDAPLSFTLDFPTDITAEPETKAAAPFDIGFSDISLNLGSMPAAEVASGTAPRDERWQEVATKLDLAKAYQEMGDDSGAREILEEVLRDGDDQQRESAQTMLKQL